jgi:hypothetical protein
MTILSRYQAHLLIDELADAGRLSELAKHWELAGHWNDNAEWDADDFHIFADIAADDFSSDVERFGRSDDDITFLTPI